MSEVKTLVDSVPTGRWRRRLGLAAVMGGVFVAALDIRAQYLSWDTVPGIDGPPAELVDRVPTEIWVRLALFTAVVAVSLPLWGKFSDTYGRRRLWLIALAIFMVGTLAIPIVASVAMLLSLVPPPFVIGTAGIDIVVTFALLYFPSGLSGLLQALGAGAVCVLAPALIGDCYPPSERAKWHGVLVAIFGLALIGGPTIRHLLPPFLLGIGPETQVPVVPQKYLVSIPIGGLAVLASWFGLPDIRSGARTRTDTWGAGAFVVAAGLILVAFDLASSPSDRVFSWLSPPIVALLAAAAVMLGLLVGVLRRATNPIVNLRLLTSRTYLIAIFLGFVVGLTLANSHEFALLFNIFGVGDWPYDSNPLRFPDRVAAALTFAVGAVLAGQVMWRTGRYKPPILVLLLLGTIGSLLLSRLSNHTGVVELALGMGVMGLSLGGLTALLIAVVQNVLPFRSLGEVTAGLAFISLLGVALVAPFYDWLQQVAYAERLEEIRSTVPNYPGSLSAQKNALGVVFVVHAALMAIGAVLALWLPEPLGLREALFKKKEWGPSLQERLRAREEEQRRAVEAANARAEQRRGGTLGDTDDADGGERFASGPQPSDI